MGRAVTDNSDSDDSAACACQYHPVLIEELEDARENVRLWCEHVDGLCAICWRVSCCRCEYVFDDDDDAAWFHLGRPVCGSCLDGDGVASAQVGSVYG